MTDYGKRIKIALIEKDMTQVKLMEEIYKRTGLKVDDSYMSKIKNGKKNPPRVIKAINEILEIAT